eukprot:4100745-Heterocapsa_arctica.AAC.1
MEGDQRSLRPESCPRRSWGGLGRSPPGESAAAGGLGWGAATGGPGGPMLWPGPCAYVLRPELPR